MMLQENRYRVSKVKRLLLIVAAGVTIACVVHSGPKFAINVGAVSPATIGKEIGESLQKQLGGTFGRNDDVEGTVSYVAKLPIIGLRGGLYSVPFHKPCGQTFEERAQEIWPLLSGGGGGLGGVCGSQMSVETGVVGYRIEYGTAKTCTPAGCHTESYVKSVEPIYGQVASSVRDMC